MFWRRIETSDPVGSSVLLPTEPSWPNSFISSELPILYRNFRSPTEVSHYFRPGVLGRKFFEHVGSSDTPSELPTRPDPIHTPLWTVANPRTPPTLPPHSFSSPIVVIWRFNRGNLNIFGSLDSPSLVDSDPLHLSSDPRGKSSRYFIQTSRCPISKCRRI